MLSVFNYKKQKQKYAKPKMSVFLPSPSIALESLWGAVFAKCIQCMLYDNICPTDLQFTGTTEDCSEKKLCLFLYFLFSLEENCRIFCVV